MSYNTHTHAHAHTWNNSTEDSIKATSVYKFKERLDEYRNGDETTPD